MNHTVTNDIFGNNLRYLRISHSVSRWGLSKLLGTSAVLIDRWENCRVYPTLSGEMLDRICVIFRVSREDLLCLSLTPDKADP